LSAASSLVVFDQIRSGSFGYEIAVKTSRISRDQWSLINKEAEIQHLVWSIEASRDQHFIDLSRATQGSSVSGQQVNDCGTVPKMGRRLLLLSGVTFCQWSANGRLTLARLPGLASCV
jgi:hypothetical protein